MFKKTTLKNGLRIITIPQKDTGAVTVLVLVGTGSKFETRETSGISHLIEHLVFKGTKKKPTPLAVIEPIDKIGGIWNAFTGEDYTGYFAKVAASYFDLALDLVSDVYLNPLFPDKEIKKEKGVIIEEINMYYDLPMRHVEILWEKLLYGDQPAGWNIAGTKETVSGISRRDIVSYTSSQYVSSNTIVCVSGNIEEAQVIDRVKKCFSEIKITRARRSPEVVEEQAEPGCLIYPKKTDQTHLQLGVRGYNIFHPQKYGQELLGLILGGMKSSRLFIEIRDKMGMAYYISTVAESNPDTGYLVTQAGIDNKRVDRAIAVILREYKKISHTKVPAAELKKAKENLKGKLSLSLETSDAKAFFYAGQELLEKKIYTSEEIFKKVDKVSTDDILKIAKDIFRSEKLNLALIGPFKDKNKFKKLLKL